MTTEMDWYAALKYGTLFIADRLGKKVEIVVCFGRGKQKDGLRFLSEMKCILHVCGLKTAPPKSVGMMTFPDNERNFYVFGEIEDDRAKYGRIPHVHYSCYGCPDLLFKDPSMKIEDMWAKETVIVKPPFISSLFDEVGEMSNEMRLLRDMAALKVKLEKKTDHEDTEEFK